MHGHMILSSYFNAVTQVTMPGKRHKKKKMSGSLAAFSVIMLQHFQTESISHLSMFIMIHFSFTICVSDLSMNSQNKVTAVTTKCPWSVHTICVGVHRWHRGKTHTHTTAETWVDSTSSGTSRLAARSYGYDWLCLQLGRLVQDLVFGAVAVTPPPVHKWCKGT